MASQSLVMSGRILEMTNLHCQRTIAPESEAMAACGLGWVRLRLGLRRRRHEGAGGLPSAPGKLMIARGVLSRVEMASLSWAGAPR